ncbi:phosphodiesterase [Thalassospira lucentensis]|uniref:phosphodiesterase n=1 Tax=Thalassospira lucentensis TaxID=168935 RepID=UPI003D2E9E49
MKFIHLSDLHILARNDTSRHPDAAATLRKVIGEINAQHRDAEICVITGDITHRGTPEQYEQAVDILSDLAIPYIIIPGNHDIREAFKDAFPTTSVDANGFVNFGQTFGGVRFVMMDSIVPGHHHGTLCDKRLGWLRDELTAHKDTPTFLFMHHPPFEMGLPFMDTIRLDAEKELGEIIAINPQIKHLFFGHLHRPATGTWLGVPFVLGNSTQSGEALDFRHKKEEELEDRNPLGPGYGIAFSDPMGGLRYHFDFVKFDM